MESTVPKAKNASSLMENFDQLSLEGSPPLPLSSSVPKPEGNNNVLYLGHPCVGQGSAPPPLNIFKKFEKGKPCAYLRHDQEIDCMVFEQVFIPERNILVSQRENGRLRKYFTRDEEEEKAVVTNEN